MTPLIGALGAPIVGALLYRILHDQPKLTRIFDLCMYIAVPGLVLWQVFGHMIEHHGWGSTKIWVSSLFMILGFALPILVEKLYHHAAPNVEKLSVLAGFSGLGLHAMLESVTLNAPDVFVSGPLILHRMVVGLMIWWVLYPRYGRWIGVIGIAGLLVVTLLGYLLAEILPDSGGEYFQAFVAGSLLHVIFHERHHGDPHAHTH